MIPVRNVALRNLAAVAVVAFAACACSGGLGALSSSKDAGGGAAGSGASGGTGATGGASGGTGATGGGGSEDCTNGIDDNNNSLVDCADPSCSTRASCVPQAPVNWLGPVWLARAAAQADLPTCPGGADPVAEGGTGQLDVPKLTCSPCSCGSPSGGQCIMQSSSKAYILGQCQGTSATETISPKPGACYNIPYVTQTNYPHSLHIPVVTQSGSKCNASGGQELSRPAASFKSFARACSVKGGGGCASGESCVGNPGAGFDPSICVESPGDLACPAGFPTKTVLYAPSKFDDTRACGGCSCGAPTGRTCSGTYTVYYNPDCKNAVNTKPEAVPTSTHCFVGGTGYASILESPGSPTGGSCASSTIPQTGDVKPTGPVTVCCR